MNHIENQIEVTCDSGRIDIAVESMNMIIEFKGTFNRDNLEKGVAQLDRYAKSTGMNRKVLIGLSPETESKKKGVLEEIKRLEETTVNLEIHVFDPQTEKLDLYKMLWLERENSSDFEKNIIKGVESLIEWLSSHSQATLARTLNGFSDNLIEGVLFVGSLVKPSSQGQLNPSY